MATRTSTKKRSTKGRSTLTTENDVAPFPVEQDVPTSRPARSNVVPFVPRRPPRPSVIVWARGHKVIPPWTHAELRAMCDLDAPIPFGIIQAMWLASWARAIDCGLVLERGCLTPSCRYDPPEDLYTAIGYSMGNVIGSLFVALPLSFGHRAEDPDGAPERAIGVGWPGTWGIAGKWGAN